ncbi:MAG: hypothetical protein EOP35_02795 [Rubrivivax sp.]|nr:MAG: hypothetical protein EOP35_02795 [Rubrivivax sp.]
MTISDGQLQEAFERFSAAELAKVSLGGEELTAYAAALRETFDLHRGSDHGSLLSVRNVLLLSSRTPYIGYAGNQALMIEIPGDASDAVVGEAALRMLDASRHMMIDYLSGRLHALERDEGMAFHQAYMNDLSARCGFRNPAAMLNTAHAVSLTRARNTGLTNVSPMRRVKADYFEGMGPDFDIEIASGGGPTLFGASIRDALELCA